MKRSFPFILTIILGLTSQSVFAQSSTWGQPPAGWDDFYVGLVNDYKNTATAVNETYPWLNVMNAANLAGTYNAGDPIKKSIHYQYKYINAGVDTSSNWYTQTVPPFNMKMIDGMLYDGAQVGINSAWVIYMLSEGAGAGTLKFRLNDPVFMEKFFWNVKYVAQKSNGHKCMFIIEPDTWGELIQAKFGGDASISATMPAQAGNLATINPGQYAYMAGLPNNLAGVCQGIIRTIRRFAPDAYVGFHTNTWSAWTSGQSGQPCTGCGAGRTGMVWWAQADIDLAVTYQLNFYNSLFNGPDYDKGDFLVMEKYGANPAVGAGGANEWMWGAAQMQNWLYFSRKMGQVFCKPLLMWQIQLGQSNAASAAEGLPTLPNTSGRYFDTFVEYMFANFNSFLQAGFIGFLGGKGLPGMTEYSRQTGYGDNGYFFKGLNKYLDPLRPMGLIQGVPVPKLGSDTTICGTGGSLLLNPGNMGGNPMTWSTGATTPTITVNTGGTYWVKIGGAGTCQKVDTIRVSNTFAVNLGSDLTLCSPPSLTLDADHAGTNVSYVWRKNGTVIAGATTRNLFVNQPGTYDVTVTDPSCLPAKTDQIVLNTIIPVPNTTACFTPPSSVNLSVMNGGGTYRWYDQPAGGTLLTTGVNYTTPVLSNTTTYYVEDATPLTSNIISKTAPNGFTNYVGNGNPAAPNDYLSFDALTTFTLNSIDAEMVIWFCGTPSTTIQITNPGTGFSQTITRTLACGGTGNRIQVTIPIGINIPAANGYRIRVSAGTLTGYYNGTNGTIVHPGIYNNIIRTTGYTTPFAMPAMFNWSVSAPSTCERVPVVAQKCNPPLPVTFINFSATKINEHALLSWITTDEINNDRFVIERSADGINYYAIGSVSGMNTSGIHQYSFTDQSPLEENYYRIVQYDMDGSSGFSKVEYLSWNEDGRIVIAPNPFAGETKIIFEGEGIREVSLLDIHGKRLSSFIIDSNEYILGGYLSAGIYILEIVSNGQKQYLKLVKQE
ncbi:MAG: T9SS type A sorting domain-containing protein [Cytophagaceae bacterium]|nr:T9SS type A sorting domain-containing protein [Cytophagaceae bacterium]